MAASYPGCREAVRKAHKIRDIPEEALKFIVASRSNSTQKQYDTALKKWWSFCDVNKIDPYEFNVSTILKFLSEEFEKGAAEGTLNSFLSAISAIHGPQVGEEIDIKRFFTGVRKLRPSLPKYDVTWDPGIVLQYFSSLSENNELSLPLLSKKLITLLALITAHRLQTLSVIRIENIEIAFGETIIIKIPDNIKTSGKNRLQPILRIPFFPGNTRVCPASTMVEYLNRTKPLRNAEKDAFLFISYRGPHDCVSKETLSRWVTQTMALAGLDTNIFSAHSTRHASTSKAKRCGVSIDVIRKTATWTPDSLTFARFYDREINTEANDFARSILNNN